MAAKKRVKNRDNSRRAKKKISVLNAEKIDYVDYKDVNLLRRFMSDRAKVRARRVTGNDTQQQRDVARAIKNAREMALVPYTNRVTTQRGGGKGGPGDRGDRGDRRDGPPPRPSVPPPPPGGVASEDGDDSKADDSKADTGPVTSADLGEGVTIGEDV